MRTILNVDIRYKTHDRIWRCYVWMIDGEPVYLEDESLASLCNKIAKTAGDQQP